MSESLSFHISIARNVPSTECMSRRKGREDNDGQDQEKDGRGRKTKSGTPTAVGAG